jgi:hypothetical protein
VWLLITMSGAIGGPIRLKSASRVNFALVLIITSIFLFT